ncbi:MAG: hypothetical protein QOK15_540 [Nocardioidaceae bacterium]|nr:hypothetical protein [Nocardioidaceae bacterium]
MIEPTPQDTGHPAVDEVLQSLGALDDHPVSEHVAVFEAAHVALREALSGPMLSGPMLADPVQPGPVPPGPAGA